MHDVAIVKAAQHMDDSVTLADVAQELVAQPFALTGTFHQSCNINNVAHSGHNPARMHQLSQFGESFIGHTHLSELRVNCTKRKVCRLCLSTRQTVEKRRFAHVRQTHNTCFQCHLILLF